ncbi:GNAT family N-acetyltransferase [Clostridium cibarium]|uniref:GNAT family N-acetyltransferase n=1 Tax=Clostridium cibarium TaxID=2762247 RepID=A0ABR8PRP5_9CLOT|nr:GNAT family N-acetyltransferase [Clostridium cibarium]MBD7910822.1 GNAT family N-acetyltransferase [Clostridium cibarium]
MNKIKYKFITCKDREFDQVIDLRFSILFEPYNIIEKYDYDKLDEISFHLVALSGDRVVAYSRMTNINGKGKITNVVVSSNFINKGIGLEMMKSHISNAKKNNIDYLYLNARLDTIDFYIKVGFKCDGSITRSEKSGLDLQRMFIEKI